MRELYLKVAFIIPRKWALAALPLHAIGADPIDRSQAHLVQFALSGHPTNIERQCLPVLHSFHAKVEPRMVVALGCIG